MKDIRAASGTPTPIGIEPNRRLMPSTVSVAARSAAVIAANAAFALADADAELVQGVVALTAAANEYVAVNNRVKFATASVPYRTNGGLLWVQCEAEAGTPTYTATTDVKLQMIIEW